MSKVFVIPDVHLKPWMYEEAGKLLKKVDYDRVVLLGDLVDEWNQQNNLGLYERTLSETAKFIREYDALFCYGNHDVSYRWKRKENGYSPKARKTVLSGLEKIEGSADKSHFAFIHRIDNTLFSHAGLTRVFMEKYFHGNNTDIDGIIREINVMGELLWEDTSPIWTRPQENPIEMYPSDMFQVVGHTPLTKPLRQGNLLSLDIFSTNPDGSSLGNERFVIVDTVDGSWNYADY